MPEKDDRDGAAVKLTILMPVYNEAETVQHVIKRLLDVSFPCPIELVVVDDASTDGSSEILDSLASGDQRINLLRHPVNRGKGAAIRTGAASATGDYIMPFDADMEYQPEDIPDLLKPVLRGEAEVVYGNRTFGSHSAYSFWYVMGNKGVTTVANILFNAYIADLETCFKLMPLDFTVAWTSARAASAWKPRSPASCWPARSAHSRCRSPTGRAAARKARRSPGRTGWPRCGC